jgi:hypothetical protein
MKPERLFYGVANDKGGLAKSVTSAELRERLPRTADEPWDLVEIEARASFTQDFYSHPENGRFEKILLVSQSAKTKLPEPSLNSLERLWSLIPKAPDAENRILVDFGASAFQSFLMWGVEHKGLQPFFENNYQFAWFIVIQGSDREAADFFNENTATLLDMGKVVLVRNLRQGDDFSMLDQSLVARVHTMTLPWGREVIVKYLRSGVKRLTFEQLNDCPTASRRAHVNARECSKIFADQIPALRHALSI